MTRTGATKGITLHNTRAIVTTRWNRKRAYTPLTLRHIENYYIDTSLDTDADTWTIDIGDTNHELGEVLDRDNEVRMQIYAAGIDGTIYLAHGMADEISYDETGILRFSGRDMSAVAVDSIAPPKHYRHVKAHAVVEQQARELGIRNFDLSKVGQVKKTQYTDGSETYWEFWHRLYRKEKAWIWTGPAGTLFAGRLNYTDRPQLYFGVPRANMSTAIRDMFIPIERCEFRKNTQQRVGEVWVYGQTGDNGFRIVSRDPTMAAWIKKPRKIIQDSSVHKPKAALKVGWEEIFEGKVGAIELRITVPETKWVIRQNQVARVRIPPMGIDDNYFIVGVRRQASADGYLQEVRLRELKYAISRRVPQDPKIETNKPGPKLGTNVAVDLPGREGWDAFFLKAAKEHHGPWDFTLFLATLIAICDQETSFHNYRAFGGPGPDRVEWYQWVQANAESKNERERTEGMTEAALATTGGTPRDKYRRTREEWKQIFRNENPTYAVGPMQLYSIGFKQSADDHFKANNRNEFSGGRWHPEHNIWAAAEALRIKCRAAGLDTGKDVDLWAGVSLYGHNADLYSAGKPTPYARSVKNKVYNDPGYLEQVQESLKNARDAAKAKEDGDTAALGTDEATPLGLPKNAAQCLAVLRSSRTSRAGVSPDGHTRSFTDYGTLRHKIIAAAMYGYYKRGEISYAHPSNPAQSRFRMTDFAPPPNVPHLTDCSAYATWCYKSAGADDPNGANYNGSGNTGSLIHHGKKLSSVSQLKQGDLVFYRGSASFPEHVVVYVGYGMCVSHGREEGPMLQKITSDAPRTGMTSNL